VIPVGSEDLKRWTQKGRWNSNERLPENFLQTLRERTGCDAVLFTELTQYRAYQPLVLGWNMKLVEVGSGMIWWSADEVFQGQNEAVANASLENRFWHWGEHAVGETAVLDCPRYFGQFTLSSLLSTMPER
jgi:hypothetical protein